MKLLFTKNLGSDFDSECVICHHFMSRGEDNVVLLIGVDTEGSDPLGSEHLRSVNGKHFDGGPYVPRNAPTTSNIGMWDRFLFHDGQLNI